MTIRIDTQEARARRLIQEIIDRLGLRLDGLVILTEMGDNHYVYTPLIAALAGAKQVIAVVKRHPRVIQRGLRLAHDWDVRDRIRPLSSLSPKMIMQADIVTNLGYVRPIDSKFISHMKAGAVVPYMREAWEYRPGDVDLAACRARNIPVMGTYENYSGLGVFDMCGPLAAKMLLEAELEINGNRIVVVGQDKFAEVIAAYLRSSGADIHWAHGAADLDLRKTDRIDALIVAHFVTDELIVGAGGWFEPSTLATHHPECTVIQFAGDVDAASVTGHGLRCFPQTSIGPYRMAQTLAYLGPKPIIDLHAAGLKVGELMWRKMQVIKNAKQVERTLADEQGLCQSLSEAT